MKCGYKHVKFCQLKRCGNPCTIKECHIIRHTNDNHLEGSFPVHHEAEMLDVLSQNVGIPTGSTGR
jgi:hypothetical protein